MIVGTVGCCWRVFAVALRAMRSREVLRRQSLLGKMSDRMHDDLVAPHFKDGSMSLPASHTVRHLSCDEGDGWPGSPFEIREDVPLLVGFGASSADGVVARGLHCFSEDSEAVARRRRLGPVAGIARVGRLTDRAWASFTFRFASLKCGLNGE